MPKRHSIRTRLVLGNTLTLALLFVAMDVVLHYGVSAILTASVDRELHARTQHIADFPPPDFVGDFGRMEPEPAFPPQPRRPDELPDARRTEGKADFRPRLLSLDGQVVRPPEVQSPWDISGFKQALQGGEVFTTIVHNGEAVRIVSRRFPEQGKALGVIQDPFSLASNDRILATVDKALLLLFPFTLICAVLGSTLVTRRMLRQVQGFTESAHQLTASDLSQRLPVTGKDEFSTLASTFNAMLERLEIEFKHREDLIGHLQRMVEQQRRFTADASHELQTPLTAIKANTSLFLSEGDTLDLRSVENRPVLEDIDQAATAMTRLVDDLLLLARSDEGQLGKNREIISLPLAIESAVALAASGKSGIATIAIKLPEAPLHIYANEAEIIRVFANLLSNAIRYTPEQGYIVIRGERTDERVRITVSDTGIGIAPEALPHLGERFFRADKSRTRAEGGTGLGLSICKSIVASHGGEIEFQSRPGEGTTVMVLLPDASGPA